MDRIESNFVERLKEHGLTVSDRQLQQFALYFQELVEWNEKMNLTAITDREQVYMKHFFDSVSLSFFVPMQQVSTLADIGSGAGFPSLPLKIMFPELQITIIDSLQKRIVFLDHLKTALELTGVSNRHGRAEDLARSSGLRDHFDLVTARAVARLNVLNEFCLPFVRSGGLFVAMKGSDPDIELTDARKSMVELKARLRQVYKFHLPIEDAERHLIVLEKNGQTPTKYPRKAGTPLKSPIT